MDSVPAGRKDQDQAQPAPIPQAESTQVTKPLAGILRRFADAYIRVGDVTKAYLVTHKDCKSANQAKARGRKLLTDPRLQAYCAQLRTQAIVSTGTGSQDADKLAWEMELRSVAFASFNAKKVPVKEKVSALRTLGESKGYLKQPSGAAGVRATFNFVVGGARRGAGRTLTVDMAPDTGEGSNDAPTPVESIPGGDCGDTPDADGGFGVDGVASASEHTSSVLEGGVLPSNPTKDVVFDLSSESESESESAMLLSDGSALLTVGSALLSAGSPQSRSQVVDSKDGGAESVRKAPNTTAPAASRSQATGRPGASDSRQSGRKGLFDASNT